MLTERQRELLADQWWGVADAEPLGSLVLLGEREALGDSAIADEERAQQPRTVALAAAVQEHDMPRKAAARSLGAIEDGAHAVVGLVVGKMAAATHDPAFEERGAGALELHRRVVIRFQCEDVEGVEMIEQMRRDVAEIRCVADATAEAFDQEPA